MIAALSTEPSSEHRTWNTGRVCSPGKHAVCCGESSQKRRFRIEFPDWTECRAGLEKQLPVQERRGTGSQRARANGGS